MLLVPEVVRNKATAAGAFEWLEALPSIVADLEVSWQIRVGQPFEHATEAFVAEALFEDGTPAVLKVHVDRPGHHAAREATVLGLAGGGGCARLLRSDVSRSALLVERLGRPMSDFRITTERRHELLCEAAAQLWRHRPGSDGALPTGADKGRWLTRFVSREWVALGRPCDESAVALALACAGRRVAAHDDRRAVLVHGDVHQWNALESPGGSGFKLVDPDGLFAEPEYDLGILMREDPAELLERSPADGAFARAGVLAGITGLDPVAIWEWGVVERVSTGLLAERIGLQPVGREMLQVAEGVAAGRWSY